MNRIFNSEILRMILILSNNGSQLTDKKVYPAKYSNYRSSLAMGY